MKNLPLIKKLQEDAAGGAVGGASVAMAATPLFASLVKRSRGSSIKVKKIEFNNPPATPRKKRTLGVKESFYPSLESKFGKDESPDAPTLADVGAKFKNMEAKELATTKDIATFGLEDDKGNTVRVSVARDQANDFEHAIQDVISSGDELEVAEILFHLKDQFDILDVDWGEMEEDEEELPPEGEMPPEEELPPEDGMGGEELAAGPSTDDVSSLLTQVIDMMKADAEARRTEALARAAESKAKEAESAAQQAAIRVKQEEQMLDMESHEKQQKEVDKEAKRLAKLAKWRHDMAHEQGVDDSDVDEFIPPYSGEEENEETAAGTLKRVTPSELATVLLRRVKK